MGPVFWNDQVGEGLDLAEYFHVTGLRIESQRGQGKVGKESGERGFPFALTRPARLASTVE